MSEATSERIYRAIPEPFPWVGNAYERLRAQWAKIETIPAGYAFTGGVKVEGGLVVGVYFARREELRSPAPAYDR